MAARFSSRRWSPPSLGRVAAAGENDFERRVRESEEAALRRVPPGKRPVTERWWWFCGVTASLWFRVVLWPFDTDRSGFENGFALLGLIILVFGTPAFVWVRRREEQKRIAARSKAPDGGVS